MRKYGQIFLFAFTLFSSVLVASSVSASSTYNTVANPTLAQQWLIAGDYVIDLQINWESPYYYVISASWITNTNTAFRSLPSFNEQFNSSLCENGTSYNCLRFIDYSDLVKNKPINLGRFSTVGDETYLLAIMFRNLYSVEKRIEYVIFNATDLTFLPIYSPDWLTRYEEYYIEYNTASPVIVIRSWDKVEYWQYNDTTNAIDKLWDISVVGNWTSVWKKSNEELSLLITDWDKQYFIFTKDYRPTSFYGAGNPLQVFNPVNGEVGQYSHIKTANTDPWGFLGVSNTFPFWYGKTAFFQFYTNAYQDWYRPYPSAINVFKNDWDRLDSNFPVLKSLTGWFWEEWLALFQTGNLHSAMPYYFAPRFVTVFENPRLYFTDKEIGSPTFYWDLNCTQNGFPSCQYDVQTGQDFCGDGNGNFPTNRISCNVSVDTSSGSGGTGTGETGGGNLFSDMFDQLGIESAPTWKNGVTMTGATQSCTGVTFSWAFSYPTGTGTLDNETCAFRTDWIMMSCSTSWGVACKVKDETCTKELENPAPLGGSEQYLGDINRFNCSAWAVSCRWSTSTSCWPNATCMVDWDYCKVKPDSIPQIVNDNGEEKESDSFFGGLFGGIMDSISNLWENLSNSMIGVGKSIGNDIKSALGLGGTGSGGTFWGGTGAIYDTSTGYVFTGAMYAPSLDINDKNLLKLEDVFWGCPNALQYVDLWFMSFLDWGFTFVVPFVDFRVNFYPLTPVACISRAVVNIYNGVDNAIVQTSNFIYQSQMFLWLTGTGEGVYVKNWGNYSSYTKGFKFGDILLLLMSLWMILGLLWVDFSSWDSGLSEESKKSLKVSNDKLAKQ